MPGFGHLDTGLGQGGAQVFAPSPIVGQYAQILQQRQAKHDLEVKQLGNTLAKGYDPSGLRNDADRQYYVKQYGDIKDNAIAAENEKDNIKKAIALAQVRQSLSDLSAFADGSKKYAQTVEQPITKEHALHPYTVDDSTYGKLMAGSQRVWNDPNNIKGWQDVVRGVDPEKQEAQYQKTNDELLKHHPATYGTESIKYGQNVFGRKTATGTSDRVIPYQDVLETQLHRATADLDYQKHLQNKYPDIIDPHPQVQLAKRVAQDVADHGQQQGLFDKPKVKEYTDTPPDKFYAHYNYELANPKVTPGQQQANTPIYRQKWVGDILNGDVEAMKRAESKVDVDPNYNGKLQFGVGNKGSVKGWISADIPAKIKYDSSGAVVETIPARRVWINPKEGNAKEKMNELLNETTGEKVDISQLETPGGKKHIGATNPSQSYKATDGKSYSHKQLLDLGYTEEQIQQAKQLGTLK